jgi:hypothetical protein
MQYFASLDCGTESQTVILLGNPSICPTASAFEQNKIAIESNSTGFEQNGPDEVHFYQKVPGSDQNAVEQVPKYSGSLPQVPYNQRLERLF